MDCAAQHRVNDQLTDPAQLGAPAPRCLAFHKTALARPKGARPVVQTTGFQPPLFQSGFSPPIANPPAFSWWLLSLDSAHPTRIGQKETVNL